MNCSNEEETFEIKEKLHLDAYKSVEQKMRDFMEQNPTFQMINGGRMNDVFQAILQCFFSLSMFVKYFVMESHYDAKLDKEKLGITDKIEQVVKSMYRTEFEFTPEYINLKLFTLYME